MTKAELMAENRPLQGQVIWVGVISSLLQTLTTFAFTPGDPQFGVGQTLTSLHNGMRKWLRWKYDDDSFKSDKKRFPIRKQEDGSSCGIAVLNAMETAMLGTLIFKHVKRHVRVMQPDDLLRFRG